MQSAAHTTSGSAPAHLVDRQPSVTPERLIAQLHPPPTFADVSFESYQPDPAEPSQSAAVQTCQRFCDDSVARRAGRKKLFGKRETLPGVGLYLDGGFEAAQEVVRRLWWPLVERDASPPKDAKTVLQEWAQGQGLPLPLYVETDRTGPPHAPVFRVQVTVQGFAAVTASGSSKRMAERAAAEMMLLKVRPANGG